MKKSIRIFLMACAALPVSVWAAPADPALQCTLLKDNALRLACFDKVYAAQFPPRNPPKAAQSEPKRTVDLARSVEGSIDRQKPTLVFESQNGGEQPTYQPSQALLNAADAYTPLSRLYDLDENSPDGLLTVREHNPMYLMPLWYNTSPNYYPNSPTRGVTDDDKFSDQKRLESKMQVSFKSKLAEDLFATRSDLWFGYTQVANWQVWNQGKESAPFRNNDYSPEIFITQPVKADLPFDGKLRMLGAGFIHQSNGQSRPSSRSWNRVYAMAGMEWGNLTVIPRVWMRTFDQTGDDDDNPDITKYMGYGDLKMQYRFNDQQTLSGTFRMNPKTGKGAVDVGYTFPLKGKLKMYAKGFHGYGESLIDYNKKQTGVGLGLMLNDWDGF